MDSVKTLLMGVAAAVAIAAVTSTIAVAAHEGHGGESDKKAEAKEVACAQCGMPVAKSPAAVRATIGDAEDKVSEVSFDSLACWFRYASKLEKGYEVQAVEMLDYTTYGEKKASWIPLHKAFFVKAKKLKFTMPPYVAAFASKDKASAFAKENETEVLSFTEMEKYVKEKIGLKKGKEAGGMEGHHH